MKTIIVLALLIVVVIGLQQYALPAWTNIKTLQNQIGVIEDAKAKFEASKEKRMDIINRLNSIDPQKLERLNSLLPPTLDREATYYFFQQIIEERAHMKLENIVLSEGVADASARRTLIFEINSSGTYDQMRALLDVIETNDRLMDVDVLTVLENDKKIYSVTMKGRMYYGN